MSYFTLFGVVFTFCIVYANCTPRKQDELYDLNISNGIVLSNKHNACTNVPLEWSSSIVSFDIQPQCVQLYPRQNCQGRSRTVYQRFNGSAASSFKKCDGTAPKENKLPPPKRINTFDLELLSTIAEEMYHANVIISPASVKSVLALLVEASSGDTEILRALQLKAEDRKSSLVLLREIQSHFRDKTSRITLESHSRIYAANDMKVKEEYEKLIRNEYGADIVTVDFAKPADAATTVNTWVNNATRGLIPKVVEEDQINRNTKLLMLNYVYLKAKWDMEFSPSGTHKECFYQPVTGCQQAMFMYRKRQLNYTNSEEFKAEIFEIPFKDPRYTLVFMLPHKDVDIYDVVKSLYRKDLLELFKLLKEETIHLRIPRTVVEFSSDKMIEPLQKLGIKTIFEKNAKLDKMVAKTSGWSVSEIIHKARIEMNEEGAEAAAVAGGNIEFLSLDVDKDIVVNRPYLFFLRDTTIPDFLFEGMVFSPDPAN